MLNLYVPKYLLPPQNIFNYRQREWNDTITQTLSDMLSAGSKYGIFIDSISLTNPEKMDLSELKKTFIKNLNIVLKYSNGEKQQEISYELPWLLDNHFFIGGNQKVAVFQLYDHPIIINDEEINLRTNIHSFIVQKNTSARNPYNFYISMFGKRFPFSHLVIPFFGVDAIKQRFSFDESFNYVGQPITQPNVALLIDDLKYVLQNGTLDKNRLLAEWFPRKSDADICEDVQLITDIDIFTKKFMATNSIVDEFIQALGISSKDDTDYLNKRIRFSEQIMFVHICKDIYNMISFLRKNKRGKFSNNSKVIISNVNQSPITQFDFSINPLSELALLTRTSLSGTGGFKKNNVPAKLRDIHPSMIGIIDTADTADRDGCGTIQYLVPNAILTPDGTFSCRDNYVRNSISISHVPFLEHDDPTRLQMSSSQQRHSIMLKKFELPMIQTGIEGMYTDKTSFIFKAERDGKVIHRDDNTIIVQYDNNTCKAFDIGYRKLYLSVADFFNVYYSVNDQFKSGDIIAESNFLKNGRLTIGNNLLTAVMVWYGYNYEDGIVLSEKIANNDTFTSVHYSDLSFEIPANKLLENLNSDPANYKPLPRVFDRLKKGDPIAKIRTIKSEGFQDVVFEPVQEHISEEDCVITDVRIYANKWDTSISQYDDAIKNLINSQKNSNFAIIENLSKYLTKDELERYLNTMQMNRTEKTKGNYKIKGESVEGILVEITAMYTRKISVGDKLGNRHGNKGVIAAIIPEDKMPTLPDGRKAEIIINPLGIPSRMNVGQLFELHLAMSFNDLKKNIRKMALIDRKEKKEIDQYIMNYIDIIDKTENKYYSHQMCQYLNSVQLSDFLLGLDNFYIIQPPFESVKWEDLDKAMRYTDTKYEYPCFDPISKEVLKNEIAFGYQYFMKLNHIAQDKIAARGTGPYAAKTAQPLAGKSRKGGQRLGEMEIWAVAAHGGEKNLKEFITTKSDSIQLRNKYTSQKMSNDDKLLDEEDDSVSQSLRLLQSQLKSMGVDYELMER